MDEEDYYKISFPPPIHEEIIYYYMSSKKDFNKEKKTKCSIYETMPWNHVKDISDIFVFFFALPARWRKPQPDILIYFCVALISFFHVMQVGQRNLHKRSLKEGLQYYIMCKWLKNCLSLNVIFLLCRTGTL